VQRVAHTPTCRSGEASKARNGLAFDDVLQVEHCFERPKQLRFIVTRGAGSKRRTNNPGVGEALLDLSALLSSRAMTLSLPLTYATHLRHSTHVIGD
jgi:hypothetical protein